MAEVVEKKTVKAAPKKVEVVEVDSNSKMIAGVAWIFAPASSLVLVLLDNYKSDKYIQFHAWQTLVYGAISLTLSSVLSFTCIVPLVFLVAWIMGVVKAFQGEMWKLPMIGDWAEEQADKAVASVTTK